MSSIRKGMFRARMRQIPYFFLLSFLFLNSLCFAHWGSPPVEINGFHFGGGLSGASVNWRYYYYSIKTSGSYSSARQIENTINYSPFAEFGYTHRFNNKIVGVKARFDYDDDRSYLENPTLQQDRYAMDSDLTVMLLAGFLLNEHTTAFLEGGYSVLFADSAFENFYSPGLFTVVNQHFILQGGGAGLGIREYFNKFIFIDVSYDFLLYSNSNARIFVPTGTPDNMTVSGPRMITISRVFAGLNFKLST